MALHRARDVADDDELPRLPDLAAPDPFGQLAGREVAPEHRPGCEAAPVGVQLVPAGAAALEPRAQQVHEPLGVAQLCARHPVEFAVAQDLAAGPGVGRDRLAIDLLAILRVGAQLDAQRRQLGQRRAAPIRRLLGAAGLTLRAVGIGVGARGDSGWAADGARGGARSGRTRAS